MSWCIITSLSNRRVALRLTNASFIASMNIDSKRHNAFATLAKCRQQPTSRNQPPSANKFLLPYRTYRAFLRPSAPAEKNSAQKRGLRPSYAGLLRPPDAPPGASDVISARATAVPVSLRTA